MKSLVIGALVAVVLVVGGIAAADRAEAMRLLKAARRPPFTWWLPLFVMLNALLGFWYVMAYQHGPHVSCWRPGEFGFDPPNSPTSIANCWDNFVRTQSVIEMTPSWAIFLVALLVDALLVAIAALAWHLREERWWTRDRTPDACNRSP